MFFKSKKNNDLSDLQLIENYKQSEDPAYVSTLFSRYTHLIFGICMKYLKNEEDSRDMTMRIYQVLTTKLLRHEISTFNGWLFLVVKNECLMQLRKEKSKNSSPLNGFMELSYEIHPLERKNGEEKEEFLERLENSMAVLNKEQKLCIQLFYLKELTYKEISESTGMSLKQVKSFIQNGKRNLKILMEKNNGQP